MSFHEPHELNEQIRHGAENCDPDIDSPQHMNIRNSSHISDLQVSTSIVISFHAKTSINPE